MLNSWRIASKASTSSPWPGDKLAPPGAFSPAPISTFAFTHNAGGNITAALKEDGSCWYYEYDAPFGVRRQTQCDAAFHQTAERQPKRHCLSIQSAVAAALCRRTP